MAAIDQFMSWLERRLQELVEGGTAWLLPGGRRRRELGGWLVKVMNENARPGSDGGPQAPDLYILTLPEAAAAQLDGNLLLELGELLRQEAWRGGLVLHNEPVVRVVADPQGSQSKVQVFFSERETSDTDTIEVELKIPARVEPAAIAQAYLVVEGRQTFMLTSPVVSIGRDPGNMLVLSDMRVSRTHAQLRRVGDEYVIFDLQSTGGTAVNGRAVIQQVLAPGDVISLAGVPLVYGQEILAGREATQELPVEPDSTE